MSLVQQIIQCCQLLSSGNNQNISKAEEMFTEMFQNNDFAPSVIQILNDQQSTKQIKLTVATQFKRFLKVMFTSYPPETQETVKRMLFQLILTMPDYIQNQLIEAFRQIILHCFPDNCNDIVQMIMSNIQNTQVISNELSFRGLFMIINTICKQYRFNTNEYNMMIKFAQNIFPFYMQILQTAVQNKMFNYTRLLFKFLKFIMYNEIPSFFNQQVVAQIYTLILQFMQIPLTFDENAEKNAHCSSLVGIMRATAHFINHNTSKKMRKSQIVTYFVEQIAPTFIQNMINHFNTKLPEKLMFFDITVLSYSLKVSSLMKLITKFFPQLFEKILFPQLIIKNEEYESMLNTPVEFLQELDDDVEFGEIGGKSGSITFIKQTVNLRAKNFLPMYVQPLMSLVPTSAQKMENDPKTIDTACNILSMIVEFFTINEQFAQYVPQLMAVTVPLLLNSGNPLLIRRGCDLCSRLFVILNFGKDKQLPQYILDVISILMNLLQSNHLISRVSAGSTIGGFIHYTCLKQSFQQILPQLYDVLLQTIKVFESEDVVNTLSDLIEIFPIETQPFSLQIIKGLMDAIVQIENNFNKLSENAQMNTSFSMSSAVSSIISIMKMNNANQQMMNGFIESFVPYLSRVMTSESEFAAQNIDSIFSILSELVRFSPVPLHPQLQKLFTLTLSITLNNLTMDGIECAEPVISTYIAKQSELMTVQENMQLLMRLIETTVSQDDQFDLELVSILRIADAVLTCCSGSVDQFAEFIIRQLIPKLSQPDQLIALHSLQTILFTIFYNPILSFTIMNGLGVLDNFIGYWYKFIPNKLPSIADKKTTLLAMVSILTIPLDQLPNIVKMNLPMFFNMMLTLLIGCEQQRKRTEEIKQQYAEQYAKEGIMSSAVKDLQDDEDVVIDDEDGQGINFNWDALDEMDDILDDDDADSLVPLDEREFVYELLTRILDGDLKDQRYSNAIMQLPQQLKDYLQKLIIEQGAKKQQKQNH